MCNWIFVNAKLSTIFAAHSANHHRIKCTDTYFQLQYAIKRLYGRVPDYTSYYLVMS